MKCIALAHQALTHDWTHLLGNNHRYWVACLFCVVHYWLLADKLASLHVLFVKGNFHQVIVDNFSFFLSVSQCTTTSELLRKPECRVPITDARNAIQVDHRFTSGNISLLVCLSVCLSCCLAVPLSIYLSAHLSSGNCCEFSSQMQEGSASKLL